jgi:antitoxin component YwqK of YwqJK toxin-antitoxin module
MLLSHLVLLALIGEQKSFFTEKGKIAEIEIIDSKISGKVSAYKNNRLYHETIMHSKDENNPSIVDELVGARKDYSDNGVLISRWEGLPTDYLVKFIKYDNENGFSQINKYQGGFLRSIDIRNKNQGSVSCQFNSDVSIMYGKAYLSYVKKPEMLYSNESPYLFDEGKCTEVYSDGRTFKNEYINDSIIQTNYSKNGTKVIEFKCNKKLDPMCKSSTKSEWNENGTPVVIQVVIDGGKIKHNRYHKNGNKSNEMFLIKGKMDSTLTYWREDGTIEEIIYYKYGTELKSEKYNTNGFLEK